MFLVSCCVLLCTQAWPDISLISFATAVRGWVLHPVQPMRTGNPLVDSVAEHQAANEQAYDMYLSTPRYFACAGLFFCWHQRTPAKIFPVTRWRVPLKPIFLAQFWHSSWCSWNLMDSIQMYPDVSSIHSEIIGNSFQIIPILVDPWPLLPWSRFCPGAFCGSRLPLLIAAC